MSYTELMAHDGGAMQTGQTEAASNAEEAVRNAERALREAQVAMDRARTEAARAGASDARPERVIAVPDGKGGMTRISLGPMGVRVDQTPMTVPPVMPIGRQRDIPSGVLQIVNGGLTAVVLMVIGAPLARAFARRIDRRSMAPATPTDVSQRLANIEQAIETVAVEVERISEGQRFTTKLLADRTKVEEQLR
jgi:hypothetical protein